MDGTPVSHVPTSLEELEERQPDLTLSRTAFEIRNVFATPIVLAPVNEAEALNAALLPIVLAHAARAQGVVRSNQGGWQSDDDFAAWSGSAGARLLTVARSLADSLTARQDDAHGLHPVRVDWKVNAWANVNLDGHANASHHHPGSFWSCVYWVQGGAPEDGGELEIQDPRGILPGFIAPQLRYALPGCLSAGGSEFIAPVTGTLLLFPSWLVHAVRPFRGSQPRVSVAINLSPA